MVGIITKFIHTKLTSNFDGNILGVVWKSLTQFYNDYKLPTKNFPSSLMFSMLNWKSNKIMKMVHRKLKKMAVFYFTDSKNKFDLECL